MINTHTSQRNTLFEDDVSKVTIRIKKWATAKLSGGGRNVSQKLQVGVVPESMSVQATQAVVRQQQVLQLPQPQQRRFLLRSIVALLFRCQSRDLVRRQIPGETRY